MDKKLTIEVSDKKGFDMKWTKGLQHNDILGMLEMAMLRMRTITITDMYRTGNREEPY